MADYDAGAVGGISIGQSPLGGEAVQDRQRDAGALPDTILATLDGTPTPLEPVYSVGAVQSLSFVDPGLIGVPGGVIRQVPLVTRV